MPWAVFVVLLLGACEGATERPASAASSPEDPGDTPARTTTLWHALGSWSGDGDRQTESFDITSGSLRISWEAMDTDAPGPGAFSIALHSSISGRPLETAVQHQGTGADTVYLAAGPRVAYLRIEADGVRWGVTLEEGVAGRPVAAPPEPAVR